MLFTKEVVPVVEVPLEVEVDTGSSEMPVGVRPAYVTV
jgi:hypothetical protein